ncbi:hypothetical protein F4779DRAFT_590003 [Xylariaceae sp. FL0662B]|nr:hypothetical protein F4779DRAFT_590003 [Xylariaceae sp. FL0662B]
MPKPKAFLKQAKPKPKKEQKLETADDFQAAGVEFEEAAGKWRAGDAAKSMRFFQRAIDVYGQGLQRFPQNIDLAYNKARVQLEIATHPVLVDQLQQPLKDVLEDALSSHQYALQLDPDNADALFNTSQVLTTIAEVMASDDDDAKAIKMLREALDLQGKCLDIQEQKYREFLEQEQLAHNHGEHGEADSVEATDAQSRPESQNADDDGEWFNVVEPVTHDTLIDTVLAELGTLTTLCGILASSPEVAPPDTLSWVEELSANLLQKVKTFSDDKPERLQEIALTRANLVSALLEAGYVSGKIDAETYKRERDAAFSVAELRLQSSAEALIANARSLMTFNSALADSQSDNAQSNSTLRWNSLTESISHLGVASSVDKVTREDEATTHLLRGDASFFMCDLALPPVSHQTAMKNAPQNVKNAAVYYRNASRLFQDPEEKDIADFKSAVAQYLQEYSHDLGQGDMGALLSSSPRGQQWAIEQLEDMISEGLVPSFLLP